MWSSGNSSLCLGPGGSQLVSEERATCPPGLPLPPMGCTGSSPGDRAAAGEGGQRGRGGLLASVRACQATIPTRAGGKDENPRPPLWVAWHLSQVRTVLSQ